MSGTIRLRKQGKRLAFVAAFPTTARTRTARAIPVEVLAELNRGHHRRCEAMRAASRLRER